MTALLRYLSFLLDILSGDRRLGAVMDIYDLAASDLALLWTILQTPHIDLPGQPSRGKPCNTCEGGIASPGVCPMRGNMAVKSFGSWLRKKLRVKRPSRIFNNGPLRSERFLKNAKQLPRGVRV